MFELSGSTLMCKMENTMNPASTLLKLEEKTCGFPSLRPLSRAFAFLTLFPLRKDFLQLLRDTVI